jgi:hypothetical protein
MASAQPSIVIWGVRVRRPSGMGFVMMASTRVRRDHRPPSRAVNRGREREEPRAAGRVDRLRVFAVRAQRRGHHAYSVGPVVRRGEVCRSAPAPVNEVRRRVVALASGDPHLEGYRLKMG